MTRQDYFGSGEDPYDAGDEQYEECEVCHQEFTGTCPINSADCPYADFMDDDDDVPDFEDVEDLKELLEDDEEVEKLLEEEGEIPVEDLVDDALAGDEADPDEDTGVLTVEEEEAATPPPKTKKPRREKKPPAPAKKKSGPAKPTKHKK